MPQDCPGMHHQGRIAIKMQRSQELQARTARKEIENATIRPLKIRQWRPPPEQRAPGSLEFVFYAGPALNSESIDPYPGLKDPASWRIPKKEAAPRQDLIVPTEHFTATRKDISPNQGPLAPPPAPAPAPTPTAAPAPALSLVPTHQAPISMIQEEEVDEEDTRINYIRPIPPERLKALKSQIEEDVDSDALAEQQLVTEYQQTLNSPRPKSKKQTRKGTKQVRHGNLFRPYRGKKAPQSTCEEDLIALATGAVLKSKLIVSAEGKPTL
jgi:hypothetical protein